jgi:hypothetical protein
MKANQPMSRTAASAFGATERAGTSAALPAVGYRERRRRYRMAFEV